MPNRRISAPVRSTVDFSTRAFSDAELSLRLVEVLEAKSVGTFGRNLYFDGGDVLACTAGRFRFSFEDGESVELSSGEVFFIYPQNVVTIESVLPRSSLNYVILNGIKVSDYFDSYGFFDRLKFSADAQNENFRLLLQTAQQAGVEARSVLSTVFDLMRNFQHEYRRLVGPVVNDAIRIIHRNLAQGSVGIKPVCDELGICRSFLTNQFLRAGLESPGAFIRRQQLKLAVRLIQTTDEQMATIAKRVGFSSSIYFAAFIRRMTGKTPSDLRTSR